MAGILFHVGSSSIVNAGSGSDGDATVSADTNLNTSSLVGRGNADMVAYNVSSLTSTSATLTASAAGIAQDDLVLLINLQGDTSSSTNVGKYEVLTVASVSDTVVNFTTSKTNYYGSGASDDNNLGTAAGNQKVMLQRIPQYNTLTVNSGFSVYGSAWNFSKYGVFSVYVKNGLSVDGSIDMSEKGYRYELESLDHTNGAYGGSIKRRSAQSATYHGGTPNDTGGAGPYNLDGGGGGGGHASAGQDGEGDGGAPNNAGGTSIGEQTLSQTMYFGGCGGGGGGSGPGGTPGTDWGQGGSGGGIILINAGSVTVNSGGTITVDGRDGLDKPNAKGSGGGAGGSIKMSFDSISAVAGSILAEKGLKGTTAFHLREGGDGADGRIALYHPSSVTLNGDEATPSPYEGIVS